jgi:cyclopropane-fatty-acyl-phospholipid synthase
MKPSLAELAGQLEAAGAMLALELPDGETLRVGAAEPRAHVRLRSAQAVRALSNRDHLVLGEAYLDGEVDVRGDWREVLKVTWLLDLDPPALRRLLLAGRLLLPRRRWNRRSIAFHYDRPAEFFLPWFERWRSYSHGFYRSPDDAPENAQARKLQFALDALGAKPGMELLDVGVGWGSFLEYAGLRGIRVHGLTISDAQFRFVQHRIAALRLPCSVERIDFFDFRPHCPVQGAVFMGSLEHLIDAPRVAAFLARHLAPGGRIYADFCSQREHFQVGAFLRRSLWPGAAAYVDVPRLIGALLHSGLSVHLLEEDTLSYACTVRDWADALERQQSALGKRFGDRPVRAFLLFLRGSQLFLETGRTQAYHLVAGRDPAPLR